MSYQIGAAPITNPNALKPANNDAQLIKEKGLKNFCDKLCDFFQNDVIIQLFQKLF